ncbi:MAG: hypothetical protein R2751_01355 [Bacteroidales bacterium]
MAFFSAWLSHPYIDFPMTQSKKQHSDYSGSEIDVIAVSQSIGKAFLNLFGIVFSSIRFLLSFVYQNLLWIMLCAMLGLLLGWILYSNSNRYYISEMLAQPNGFSSVEMANYINDLHELSVKRNYLGIQDAFQIEQEDAKMIKNIEAFFLIDVNHDQIGDYVDYKYKYSAFDTSQHIVENRLLIRAEVFDSRVFHKVKAGLKYYVNNNPYLTKVNELRKEELDALINLVNGEIRKLDSLQQTEYFAKNVPEVGSNKEASLFLLSETPTQLYYKDKIALLEKKLEYEQEFELSTDPITVIKDFTELDIEVNPLSDYLLKYARRMALAGFVLILVVRWRKKIKTFLLPIENS